ncbi:MAG: hypothetical protein MPL62_06940 [Alphaproteobacteria bacterium]|nr:hypothetical protein [Alphaproteobacteria bacterium]
MSQEREGVASMLLDLMMRQAAQYIRREMEHPNGWESDPRTGKIRRKGQPHGPAAKGTGRKAQRRAKARPRRDTREYATGDVIDICPRCGQAEFLHEGKGQRKRCPRS